MAHRLMALLIGSALLGAPPVRAASPDVTGLWEGLLHRARGDQPVAIVLRPRGASSFAGMVYFANEEFGPIEAGRLYGDSLAFRATNYPFTGAIEGKTMALSLMIPHGATHDFTLTQTSPDTTRLPASVQNAPPAASHAAIHRDAAPDSIYMAHAVSPDAAPGMLPCLQHGTLLLVGGGPGQADLYARFLQLAGGTSAHIVVIPTAHIETTDRAAIEQFGDNTAGIFGVAHVQVLHTFSRQEADSEAFVKPLRTATGVWIDGGEGSYLLNAYMGTRTERELIAVLDRGGVIAGTSAGALIWGSRSMVSRAHAGAKAYELPKVDLLIGHVREPGFGVLQNVLISPHFAEFKMQPTLEKMLAAYPHLLAFGIDEATAIEVHAGTCTVLGRSNVSVFRGDGAKPLFVLRDGARFDLHRLVVL